MTRRRGDAETRGPGMEGRRWTLRNQANTGNGVSPFQLPQVAEAAIIGFKDKVWGKVSNKSNGDGVILKNSSEI
jgi:hypothetical protein